MSKFASIETDDIRRRGSIRDSDVTMLRHAFEETGTIAADEAEALFNLHAATPIQDPTWSRFFIDAITEYVVHQAAPEGYVDARNARWLREQISTFGRVETTTELSLLVHVLETARWTPPSLAAFALDQIRHAIETGSGPLRSGQETPAGSITPQDVELAARIIRAFGNETSSAVTRSEADALIAINRAIEPGQSSPAWSTLLVLTVGSAVLAATGHSVPPRRNLIDMALAPERSADLIDLFLGPPSGRRPARPEPLANADHVRIWRTARLLTSEEGALARLERQRLEIVTNEVIDEATSDWLIECLSRSLPVDANEAALIAYVAREASRLPPALAQLAAQYRIAA